jgi:hypothetical protein
MKILAATVLVTMIGSAAIADSTSEITYVPMAPEPAPLPPPEPMSRTPAYIAGGISLGLLATTIVVFWHGSGDGSTLADAPGPVYRSDEDNPAHAAREAEIRHWYLEMTAVGGATILAGIVTTVLWTKSERHDARRVQVSPISHGVAFSFGGGF